MKRAIDDILGESESKRPSFWDDKENLVLDPTVLDGDLGFEAGFSFEPQVFETPVLREKKFGDPKSESPVRVSSEHSKDKVPHSSDPSKNQALNSIEQSAEKVVVPTVEDKVVVSTSENRVSESVAFNEETMLASKEYLLTTFSVPSEGKIADAKSERHVLDFSVSNEDLDPSFLGHSLDATQNPIEQSVSHEIDSAKNATTNPQENQDEKENQMPVLGSSFHRSHDQVLLKVRSQELERIQAALKANGKVYVCGRPGCGKTSTIIAILKDSQINYSYHNCAVNARFKVPSKNTVLILDEVDHLKDSEQWIGLDLSVIAIANELIEHPNVQTVRFAPYTHAQILSILEARNNENLFEKSTLGLIARKTEKAGGDMRHALDLCLKALDHSRCQEGTKVTMKDCLDAFKENTWIDQTSTQQRVIVLLLKESCLLSELHTRYSQLLSGHHLPQLTRDEFLDTMGCLETLGHLRTDKPRGRPSTPSSVKSSGVWSKRVYPQVSKEKQKAWIEEDSLLGMLFNHNEVDK